VIVCGSTWTRPIRRDERPCPARSSAARSTPRCGNFTVCRCNARVTSASLRSVSVVRCSNSANRLSDSASDVPTQQSERPVRNTQRTRSMFLAAHHL
jgi:hypothetical protein